MTDLQTFQDETRAWLEANAPASLRGEPGGLFDGYWGGRAAVFPSADHRVWFDLMVARGWTAPRWPLQYGGGDLSPAEAAILQAELGRLKLPPPLIGFGLVMIGPTLLEFGTDSQKAAHLPAIARGEIRWCQGYSEPGSGSDLASLQTSAILSGDAYKVTGQKVWTSYADQSDWMFCLVRTDPDASKHAGISFILFDLDTPGVTIRPISLISGASPFCEVFLDDVHADPGNIIGGVGAGWTVAKALLRHERTMVGEIFARSLRGGESELVALARRHRGPATGPLAGVTRDRIAQVAMAEEAFVLTARRFKDAAQAGRALGAESSLLKVFGTELNQARRALAVELAGLDGLGWTEGDYAPADLALTRDWLRSRGNTIEGGTTEIQLNILAKHVLKLGGRHV